MLKTTGNGYPKSNNNSTDKWAKHINRQFTEKERHESYTHFSEIKKKDGMCVETTHTAFFIYQTSKNPSV